MFGNYLSAALRNLARNRLHSVITTLSLAIGFAAMIVVLLYWRYEHTFDRHWPASDRVYMAQQEITGVDGTRIDMGIPSGLAAAIPGKVAGVEAVGRLDYELAEVSVGSSAFKSASIFWVDPAFFDVLQRPVVAGDLAATLADPGQAAISEELAELYFGDKPAVGQTLVIKATTRKAAETFPVRVGAVLKNHPAQTHLEGDAIYLTTASRLAKINEPGEQALVYFRVRPGTRREAVAAAVSGVTGAELAPKLKETRRGLVAKPLHDIYLRPDETMLGSSNNPTTRQSGTLNSILFLSLGALILFVASLNFITLMTARGAGRAVEVGVRKAAGARRRDLVVQFVGEALVYSLLAFIVGMAVAEFILPLVRKVVPDLRLDYAKDIGMVVALAGGALVLGAIAGLYPALALSSFRPATVLKGGRVKSPGSALLRQILMTAQFTPALLLAFGALTIYAQLERSARNALTMVDPAALMISEACTPYLRDRIAAVPGVTSVVCLEAMGASNSPQTGAWHIGQGMSGDVEKRDGGDADVRPTLTDADGLRFFDAKPLAGRLWNGAGDEAGVIVNESAMRSIGFTDPKAAVGATVNWTLDQKQMQSRIIAVLADRGGFSGYEANLYYMDRSAKRTLSIGVKVAEGRREAVLAAIDAIWKESGALKPMEREFYGDWVQEGRVIARRIMGLLGPIALAAITISALGLFGLAAFLAEQRTKEVGVRKALGAGRRDLLRMLLMQFTRPVLLAAMIAVPVVFLLLNVLMQRAPPDQRIMPSLGVYIAVIAGAAAIALAATFLHAWRVTGARPVQALRYE